MTKKAIKPKRAWFGLSPKETERYIRKLKEIQRADAAPLEEQILAEKAKNRQWKAELERLRTAMNTGASSDAGLADFVHGRLERSVEAVRRQGEAERQSLSALLEAKREERSRSAEEADQQFARTRQAFDELLAEALRLFDALTSEATPPDEVAPIGEQELRSAFAVLAEPLEWVKEDSEEQSARRSGEQTEEASDRLSWTANVIQFRLRSILDRLSEAEPRRDAVTADGVSIPTARQEIASAQSEAELSFRADAAVARGTAGSPVVKVPDRSVKALVRRKVRKEPSPFWGDVIEYMVAADEVPAAPEMKAEVENDALFPPAPSGGGSIVMPQSREIAGSLLAPAHEEAAAGDELAALGKASPVTHAASNAAGAGTAAEKIALPDSQPSEARAASPALAAEIRVIQQRYIIGKKAGENLYDEAGALIIAKGEEIAAATIDAAERAGKLADLIVQMVIPGLEDGL